VAEKECMNLVELIKLVGGIHLSGRHGIWSNGDQTQVSYNLALSWNVEHT
jgi:hypothetical protein